MSDAPKQIPVCSDVREADDEEEHGAFIDLSDAENVIVDESKLGPVDEEDGDDHGNYDHSNSSIAEGACLVRGCANTHGNENEECDTEDDCAEDLNEVPDREPERDDALSVFTARDAAPVHAIVAHPSDASIFAAGGQSDEVYILQLSADCRAVKTAAVLQEVHTDTVSVLAFSPDGSRLASGGLDGVVAIWSTATWQLQHGLHDLSGELLSLLWHPSGLVLVAGADDGQAAMWNVLKGSLAMYFAGHSGAVNCTAWSPCRKRLVTGGGDGSVIIFAPRTGQQEAHIAKGLSPDRAAVTALCCLGDCDPGETSSSKLNALDDYDDRCIVGCDDGTLHVVSLRTGRAVCSLQEVHNQAVESLQVNSGTLSGGSSYGGRSPDRSDLARLFLSASCDCKVAVWSVTDLSLRAVFHVGESVIPAVWAHGHLIVAGCSDGEVKVWDGRSQQQMPLARFMGHRRMVLHLAVVEHHGIIASASDDGTVRFFKPEPT
ncbi:WD domain [Trypanosoma vivax]|uniref:Uncharacterized protein n=1 Tax=Trypanosoma vivax (strain Y486) TaxID=1055687 RepID=G0TW34_TRYVY|nr:hypothetical protein TRVL_00301 [Trypanosoma vivax]KAH8606850.1 WD domain [Trypanosoma vivax]CCC48150.1 conserved hypothetical protein [Trypanosoma vivax Y486]